MNSPGARSQSETLGVVLLLGITLLSVGALVIFGSAAIDGTQHSVDVQSAEHALSQLDSRVSLVALSDADRQYVELGRGRQGGYTVHPDEGRITITHLNYTANAESDDDYELYNETLGEVRYETGETTLAYQGGGVWRSEASGGSSMVSTPEFHYRGMTLTLPVIRVGGEGSISGNARANVYSETSSVSIYPNPDDGYPDSDQNFTNPVQNGTIQIAIQSDYYRAWVEYFETRTDGEVTVDHENETAIVELVSTGMYGDFDMPLDGNAIELRALGDGHPLSEFEVTIAPDKPDSREFTGLSYSLVGESGNKEFEVSLGLGENKSCDAPVSATVYYYNGTVMQGWYDDDAFSITCKDVNGDDDKEARIIANLTSNDQVSYEKVGNDKLTHYNPNNKDFADSTTFEEHAVDDGETFNESSTSELGYVVNHYVGLMGENVDLRVVDGEGGSGNIDEDSSSGYLITDGSGQYVTYLHISENNVTVDVE